MKLKRKINLRGLRKRILKLRNRKRVKKEKNVLKKQKSKKTNEDNGHRGKRPKMEEHNVSNTDEESEVKSGAVVKNDPTKKERKKN